jgi:DNA polymerase-3 subunit epsilon
MGWFSHFFGKETGEKQPKEVQDYLQENARPPAGNSPVKDLVFSVIDTEMTGLDSKASLLSIGVVMCTMTEIRTRKCWEAYFDVPKNEYNPGSSHVHGIIPAHQNTIATRDGLLQLIQNVGSTVCVAHHKSIDQKILNAYLKEHFQIGMKNKWLDTFALAKRIDNPHGHSEYSNQKKYSLDELCVQQGITIEDRHTALGDAYMTALLLIKFLHILEKRGIKKWRDLR